MASDTKKTEDGLARKGGLVSKRSLKRSWLIWEMFPQTCYNYERMMGQAVAHTFVPVVKELYKDDPEKQRSATASTGALHSR